VKELKDDEEETVMLRGKGVRKKKGGVREVVGRGGWWKKL
jgi:hypothetical protein